MCILATAQTKQAVYVKEALYLKLIPNIQDNNFVSIQSGDIETVIIHEFDAIGDSILSHSNQIIDVPEKIYDDTDDIGLERV
ncbi:MAG: hypothetical protein EZS28_051992 [Streblomastix strix]|uniref:Uncharacterized protein n=1 Tax=Streblomastix strix TaxID=222440 RepID=A0A5J4SPA7_9EUKA|nr:MAG: hypothetical protein EZS28_051992 [Streblomastix strix]